MHSDKIFDHSSKVFSEGEEYRKHVPQISLNIFLREEGDRESHMLLNLKRIHQIKEGKQVTRPTMCVVNDSSTSPEILDHDGLYHMCQNVMGRSGGW